MRRRRTIWLLATMLLLGIGATIVYRYETTGERAVRVGMTQEELKSIYERYDRPMSLRWDAAKGSLRALKTGRYTAISHRFGVLYIQSGYFEFDEEGRLATWEMEPTRFYDKAWAAHILKLLGQ